LREGVLMRGKGGSAFLLRRGGSFLGGDVLLYRKRSRLSHHRKKKKELCPANPLSLSDGGRETRSLIKENLQHILYGERNDLSFDVG